MRWIAAIMAPLLTGCVAGQGSGNFYLKDGDRVVFYGDSITQQRLYTTFAETYVVTRFPKRNVTFVHSGWGGDRVDGGRGGPIDVRLQRDVIAYKPNVVTIMLGMNDAAVRPFDKELFDRFTSGYTSLVGTLQSSLPGVRITAIDPSPYDDVTRPPLFAGGYNAVLLRYGAFVRQLAAQKKLDIADLNRPVAAMLQKAYATDKTLAARIIPDRVHPTASGHLIMAEALLRAWGAPAEVSAVEIDAAAGAARVTRNTQVSDIASGSTISWTQKDEALPMPVDPDDAAMQLAIRSSDFVRNLNQQPLKITGLRPGFWALRIDGRLAGVFSQQQWAQGVNLALLPTPMADQAAKVHGLTLRHNNVHFARWREVQVALADDDLSKTGAALAALDALEDELVARQRAAAQPVAHKFELSPSTESAAALESGFEAIFNGSDFTGWSATPALPDGWQAANGELQGKTGPQGALLRTDRKYRNFEITFEMNPDPGAKGGLLLRSNEKGQAYQVSLGPGDQGALAAISGRQIEGARKASPNTAQSWKKGQWNRLRVRMEGKIPRIQIWLNDSRVVDYTDSANHSAGGADDGAIALQIDGGAPGALQRFRNLSVRELP